MKKMVITGVNGFIGRHAKEYFEKWLGTEFQGIWFYAAK